MRGAITAALFYLLMPSSGWAGFDEGFAAYERADYATAMREWKPLADDGHANAQYHIGTMNVFYGIWRQKGLPQCVKLVREGSGTRHG